MRAAGRRTIAVTGGVGCGKSSVAGRLRSAGVPVLDADDVARALLGPGQPVGRRVLRVFGDAVRAAGGGVDRRALARRVFRDPEARAALNRLVHPPVLRACRRWLRETPGPVVAVVLPLLHELALEREWPEIWCVTARRDLALGRLARRGWSRAEGLRRMRAQLPLRVKAARSTRVIENNGSLRDLDRAVKAALGRKKEGTP